MKKSDLDKLNEFCKRPEMACQVSQFLEDESGMLVYFIKIDSVPEMYFKVYLETSLWTAVAMLAFKGHVYSEYQEMLQTLDVQWSRA